jgi:hypothetical protein
MPSLVERFIALLGARLDSPELAAFCTERGLALPKPSTDADSQRAVKDKKGGFELYISHDIEHRRFYPPTKVGRAYVCYLSRVLFEASFTEKLPFGVTKTMAREDLVRALGEPHGTNGIGDEMFEKEVAPDLVFSTTFRPETKKVGNLWLSIATGWKLDTHPLHFETEPPEGKPAHAETLATGLLLAWAADRVGLAPAIAQRPRAAELAKREITGRQFLVDELGGHLLSTDLAPGVGDFLHGYLSQLFDIPDEAKREDISSTRDYLASFAGAVKNPFLVPDTWDAFDRYAPILDARWADYQATKFQTPEPTGLYEAAAKKRDAITIAVTTPAAASVSVPADTTDKLMAIVGRSPSEKDVKALLVSLGLPVGKTIDKQALAKLGVSYMATRPQDKSKMPPGLPQKAVVITEVTFYTDGIEEYVRGLGTKVQYLAYTGALPKQLAFTDDRAAVHAKLGAPSTANDTVEWWDYPELERRVLVRYADGGARVAEVLWGMPAKWDW